MILAINSTFANFIYILFGVANEIGSILVQMWAMRTLATTDGELKFDSLSTAQ